MVATAKELRQPPSASFENYVLTYEVGSNVGLMPIATTNMPKVIDWAGLGGFDKNSTNNASGSWVPTCNVELGFEFPFSGSFYDKATISQCGFLALQKNEVWTSASFSSVYAKYSLFNSGAIRSEDIAIDPTQNSYGDDYGRNGWGPIFSVWTQRLRNLINRSDGYTELGEAFLTLKYPTWNLPYELEYGTRAPMPDYEPAAAGTRYYRGQHSEHGRFFVTRWSSLSSYATSSTSHVIKFECVLYENGRIEYRYAPRSARTIDPTVSGSTQAAVGVFASGTNLFRDFSYELGYDTHKRARYRYGGTVYDASYEDLYWVDGGTEWKGRPFGWRLHPTLHWPGQSEAGGMFVFQPPMNRRKILPHKVIAERSSHESYPYHVNPQVSSKPIEMFDDRRSMTFKSGTLVNYPVGLKRSAQAGTSGWSRQQDLFAGDFIVTGSTDPNSTDVLTYAQRESRAQATAFTDTNVPQEGEFYATGTSLALVNGFSAPLRSKTRIDVSLPLVATTRMLETTSSILYYAQPGHMRIKQVSDLRSPYEDRDGSGPVYQYGDAMHLFSAFGSQTTSGSRVGTLRNTYDPLNGEKIREGLQEGNTGRKSMATNPDYRAGEDETFTLPISQPFLIEKAVFEIPLELGDSWFSGTTQMWPVFVGGAGGAAQYPYDHPPGGGAITCALFHQAEYEGGSVRNLIMSGTIIPVGDNKAELVARMIPPTNSSVGFITYDGFLSAGAKPSAVVEPNAGDNTFTGSVKFETVAMNSNGCLCYLYTWFYDASAPWNRQQARDLMTGSQRLNLYTFGNDTAGSKRYSVRSAYYDVYGRAQTIEQTGQSLFGQEFNSVETKLFQNVPNNFFAGSDPGSIDPQVDSIIDAATDVFMGCYYQIERHTPSPYIVYPGQKLVFAVSRFRPMLFTDTAVDSSTSYEACHSGTWYDVKIVSGSAIKIQLFGSFVKEDTEFHDTLPRPPHSDAVHETIHFDNPVLDQLELATRQEYSGSLFDAFVTGSWVRSTNKTLDVPTDSEPTRRRGKQHNLIQVSNKDVNGVDLNVLGQPIGTENYAWEWATEVFTPRRFQTQVIRGTKHVCDTERFYDSLFPAMNEVFDADGATVYWNDNPSYGGTAYFFLDVTNTGAEHRWSGAYPFEPHYSRVNRVTDHNTSWVASARFSGGGGAVPPGLRPGAIIIASRLNVDVGAAGVYWKGWWSDMPATQGFAGWPPGAAYQSQGRLRPEHFGRFMYGFGDLNTIALDGSNHGTNHAIDEQNGISTIGQTFSMGPPLIRGWKYGLINGNAFYTAATWRTGRYGQFRDMLEQRLDSTFYTLPRDEIANVKRKVKKANNVLNGPVSVRFINPITNTITQPDATWSSNLSQFATSSLPYFDGITTNRPEINEDALNLSIATLESDQNNNVTL
jgi:hypothetical protein